MINKFNFKKIGCFVSLFLIVILFSLYLNALNLNIYKIEFSKNNVYFNINETVANNEAKNVIYHLIGFKLETNLFNTNEISHMKDVSNLFKLSYVIFIICIVFLIYNFKEIEFVKYSSISIITLIVFGLMMIFNFNFMFTIFHKILFSQGNWSFPIGSKLITLFPIGFFINMSFRIWILAVSIFVSIIITYYINKYIKKKINKN